jgi:hypothetical protein
MSKTVVVQYKTRPDAAEENQRLVEAVYAELAERQPEGFRYATFRLDDGVSFVHVAMVEGDTDPLGDVAAFKEFVAGVGDRVTDGPHSSPATAVGAYRWDAGA